MQLTDSFLGALEVQVEPFAICDVRSGSHLDLPADQRTTIHYVLTGSGSLVSGSGEVINLQADQMILIPEGLTQHIESRHDGGTTNTTSTLCSQPADNIQWLKSGNGDTNLLLACGRIHATLGQGIDIFNLLEQPLVESFEESNFIRMAFESILLEFGQPQLGTHAMAGTLMKQCLILMMRRLHEQNDWRLPWLAVLDNPGLQAALNAMLTSPEHNHRVDELADLACMSRSSFSEHFARALGQAPHEFISSYRLRRAARLLTTTSLPIKSIAAKVGYQSRSSFSRAFKSHYQRYPAGYRQLKQDK